MKNAAATTTSAAKDLEKKLTLSEVRSFYKNDHIYESRDGYIVNVFGKYQPNITFLISSSFELDDKGNIINPLAAISDGEMAAETNVKFNGNGSSVGFIFGDFWRSRKGGACFRPKSPTAAKHVLVKVAWGGAFSHTGGNSSGANTPGILYFRRASSNGGGMGSDYYVLPVGYHLIRDSEGGPQGWDVRNADKFRQKHAKLRQEARAQYLRAYQERMAAEAASREAREEFLPRLREIQAELKKLCQPQASGVKYSIDELVLGETFFELGGYKKYLYGAKGVAEAEDYLAYVSGWIEKAEAKQKAKADNKRAFEPEFRALQPKLVSFGWEMTPDEEGVQVKDPAKPAGWGYDNPKFYPFTREGVKALRTALAAEDDRRVEEARKARQEALEKEGEKEGLPSNLRIWHRNGATNAGKGWVIRPDGTDRECDSVDTSMLRSNTKRFHQKYEGDHVWRQICPGELVIAWSKAYTAAEHVFKVISAPKEITEAQLERVAQIQDEIEEAWRGRTGLASGRMSPPIGQGWGLFPRKTSGFGIVPDTEAPKAVASSEVEPAKEEGIDTSSPMAKAFMAAKARKK